MSARGPVLAFSLRSLKAQYKLALLSPSEYTKTLLCNYLGIQMNSCGLLKSLCSQQGQTENSGGAQSIL